MPVMTWVWAAAEGPGDDPLEFLLWWHLSGRKPKADLCARRPDSAGQESLKASFAIRCFQHVRTRLCPTLPVGTAVHGRALLWSACCTAGAACALHTLPLRSPALRQPAHASRPPCWRGVSARNVGGRQFNKLSGQPHSDTRKYFRAAPTLGRSNGNFPEQWSHSEAPARFKLTSSSASAPLRFTATCRSCTVCARDSARRSCVPPQLLTKAA